MEVQLFDIVLQVEDAPQHVHREDHAGGSGVDGADHKIGTKDAAVPSRAEGHGEDPRDHGVHGDRQRDDEDGHERNGFLQQCLLLRGSGPADGQRTVEAAAPGSEPGLHGQERQIRDHGDIEIQDAAGQVGAHAQHIPNDGRLDTAVAEQVQHAVGPSHVNHDHGAADAEGKNGDSLGHARDRRAPFGIGDAQDGRDQSAGVADADEENEIGNVQSPGDLVAHAGDDEPVPQLLDVGVESPKEYDDQESHPDIEPPGVFQHRTQKVLLTSFHAHLSIQCAIPGISVWAVSVFAFSSGAGYLRLAGGR